MPFKSQAQRRYLHAKHPKIAARWEAEEKKVQKSSKRLVDGILIPVAVATAGGVAANQFPQNKKKSKAAVEPLRGKIKKYEPVFKSEDPNFNHRAAQAAYDLVMKMEPEQAREFTFQVVNEVTEELIEKNLRRLQPMLNQVIAKRIEQVKRATVRASVSKSDSAVEFAKALVEIEKASKTPYDYGYRFQESDFSRDPGTGRFRTKITHSQTKPLSDRTARSMGVRGTDDDGYQKLSTRQKAQYQDEYRQLAGFLSAVNQSTRNPGDSQVVLHFRDTTGNRFAETLSGTTPPKRLLQDPELTLVGAEARPTSLTVGGAAFGLSSALGDQKVKQINAADAGFGSFASDWTNQTADPRRPNDQMYGRLEAGSKFLGQVAPDGSKAQIAAEFGRFVGSHGPEAEAVIGPAARKTAYRYRGTERAPDERLVTEYGSAINSAKARSVHGQDLSMVQQAAQRIQNERRDPTWEERASGRAAVLDYLNSAGVRPKAGLYNLQLHSGNTPPSEGVILDAEGKIAAQAVGYGDDHYLPFNLKHLKSLKGGEYIRNRSVGGPTSEDIYAGLISGARQVTVTSRSGTFTVKFKDDFRGGRRHNDKARRMVRRYEQLLDAVQSEQVDRHDVLPEVRDAITAEVKSEAHPAMSRKEINDEITRRINDYKASPDIDEGTESIVNFLVAHEQRYGDQRSADELREQWTNKLAADKEYKFRLNGVGYAGALEALREQFPYYIEVTSNPTRDPERQEMGIDRGYVEPGRNRPTSARAGLYGTKVNPGEKVSASQTDYQGARIARRGGTPDGVGRVEESAETTKTPETKPTPAHQLKAAQVEGEYEDAAVDLREMVKSSVAAESLAPVKEMFEGDADDFRAWVKEPENQKKFHDWVQRDSAAIGSVAGAELAAYKLRSGWKGRKAYESALAHQWNEKPFVFEGEAYTPGATGPEIDKELRKIGGSVHGIVQNKPLQDMTDAELKEEVQVVGKIRQQLSRVGDAELSFQDKAELLSNVPKDSPSLKTVMTSPEKMGQYLETVHRVRALRSTVPAETRAVTSRAADPGDIVVTNPAVPKTINQQTELRNHAAMLRYHLENQPDSDEVEVERLRNLENALDEEQNGPVNLEDVKAAHPLAWADLQLRGRM